MTKNVTIEGAALTALVLTHIDVRKMANVKGFAKISKTISPVSILKNVFGIHMTTNVTT